MDHELGVSEQGTYLYIQSVTLNGPHNQRQFTNQSQNSTGYISARREPLGSQRSVPLRFQQICLGRAESRCDSLLDCAVTWGPSLQRHPWVNSKSQPAFPSISDELSLGPLGALVLSSPVKRYRTSKCLGPLRTGAAEPQVGRVSLLLTFLLTIWSPNPTTSCSESLSRTCQKTTKSTPARPRNPPLSPLPSVPLQESLSFCRSLIALLGCQKGP